MPNACFGASLGGTAAAGFPAGRQSLNGAGETATAALTARAAAGLGGEEPPPAAWAPAAPATSATTPSGARRRTENILRFTEIPLPLDGWSRAAAVAADEQHGAGGVAGR